MSLLKMPKAALAALRAHSGSREGFEACSSSLSRFGPSPVPSDLLHLGRLHPVLPRLGRLHLGRPCLDILYLGAHYLGRLQLDPLYPSPLRFASYRPASFGLFSFRVII